MDGDRGPGEREGSGGGGASSITENCAAWGKGVQTWNKERGRAGNERVAQRGVVRGCFCRWFKTCIGAVTLGLKRPPRTQL